MKILIIEDEQPAANRLTNLLEKCCPEAEVLDVLDSVKSSVNWLKNLSPPDLIFMDIQIADGLSFDIFSQLELYTPVIFTTAYDQYMLKAFKVNSVDYLLKPIEETDLKAALDKFQRHHLKQEPFDRLQIDALLKTLQQPAYKERFLVKSGTQLFYIPASDIAYFFSEDGLTFLQTHADKRYIVEQTLDQLANLLDPRCFFRINRQVVVSPECISKISAWYNHRLKLEIKPPLQTNTVVSREKVSLFKAWLDG